jgi:mono/diheme cytochrome c family protein
MRLDGAVIALLALAAGGVALAGPPSSVWKGVYTDAQSRRGKAEYEAACAECHGPTLSGGDNVPDLSGAAFLANWDGLSAQDLFSRIRTTMPASKPGTLSDSATVEVMAYVFQVNHFPAGDTELPMDPGALRQIAITKTAP